ncbi:MAG: response regulator transcription factor [Cyanobacteriota bacterium]
MSDDKIKILIVDDSKLTRVGLRTTFKTMEDMEVVGEAENGQQGIDMVISTKPDVILMDIGMPILDGIKATQEINSKKINVKIIMLTSHDNDQDVFDAFSAGAHSYCMKDIEPDMLATVIKSTHNGASWLDPRIAKIVLQNFGKTSGQEKKSDHEELTLTEREIDVLHLIARGYSNSEISKELCISMNTVKTHIRNIFHKLEVEDRTQAAMKAVKKDIIKEEDLN